MPVDADPVVGGYCSSEDSLYQLEYLYNKSQSLPYRCANAALGDAQWVMWDLQNETTPATMLALLNHNLVGTSVAAPFVLTLSGDNGPNWGDPAYGPIDVLGEGDTLTRNIWLSLNALGTTETFQYWRLDITDPDNPYNYEFGELVHAVHGSFTRNYDWGYTEALRYIKAESRTLYGQRHRKKLAKQKYFMLTFNNVVDADIIGEVEDFFEALGGEYPFVFIPDAALDDCWYVLCLNDLDAKRNFLDINSFTLELEEEARGITLL